MKNLKEPERFRNPTMSASVVLKCLRACIFLRHSMTAAFAKLEDHRPTEIGDEKSSGCQNGEEWTIYLALVWVYAKSELKEAAS